MRRKKHKFPKTTFKINVNKNVMVAGGLPRKLNAYVLVHARKKYRGIPFYGKASVGTKGAIVGAGAGRGRWKSGIDYNLTTKQVSPRTNIFRRRRRKRM